MKIATPEFLSAEFFMRDEAFTPPVDLPNVMPSQVHGRKIIRITDENFSLYSLPERPEADGVLLMTSKAQASLRFADCAPVMIWSKKKTRVMILHSGYKGTVLNISGEGIKLLDEALENLCAWIGPSISRKTYCRKINDEWTQKGLDSFHSANFDIKDEFVYFDLAGEIRSELIDAGLDDKNIILSGIDTFTDTRCYSYRRGDVHERMTLNVSIKSCPRP